MVTFDSPLHRCERCGEFVLMDQTVCECADEHQCDAASCPVLNFFEGKETCPAGKKGNSPVTGKD